MKFRIKATVLAIFFGWFPFAQSAQYPATGQAQEKAEVLDADASYRHAVISGDTGKLANLFADDILIVHSDGGTDTKVNFLDAISSRRLRLTSYEQAMFKSGYMDPQHCCFRRRQKSLRIEASPEGQPTHRL